MSCKGKWRGDDRDREGPRVPRQEPDRLEILSGIFNVTGEPLPRTTGTPISLVVYNKDAHSKSYDNLRDIFRPGHGDITYQAKYGIRDHRGGGRASARETAARVAGGAIAAQVLASTVSRSWPIPWLSGAFGWLVVTFP